MIDRLRALDPRAQFDAELATPLTLARYTLASNGTPYGLAGTPAQFNARRPGAVTHLPGLFLAGASTRTAHGVAGALASGRLAARAAGTYLTHQPRREALTAGAWRGAASPHAT